MKQNFLRAKMKMKRKFRELAGLNSNGGTSIFQFEKPSIVASEKVADYSPSTSITFVDPRNGLEIGHYFQKRSVFLVKDVILEPRQGLIYSSDGFLLEESTCWSNLNVFNSFPWVPGKLKSAPQINSALYIPSNSYWHWLIEDLAPTIFALQLDVDSPIIVASRPPKYVLDFLELQNREIIFVDGPVRVNSLMMVQKVLDSGWPHPKDREILLRYEPFSKVRTKKKEEGTKLYISRRKSKRSPANEIEIEKLFLSRGFEIAFMEDLNLLDEISLLSSVKSLAGVHGAGLANMLWMPEGGKVLDIVREDYWTESMYRLASLGGSAYESMLIRNLEHDIVSIESLSALVDEKF
jgi:hypothetical protein